MSILSFLRARIQNPGARDFADMGLGIEARYLRCKPYWKRHLLLSQEFQRRHLEEVQVGGAVAVLGAGRLLDVDLPSLARHFTEIRLYDADPTVVPVWKRAGESLAKPSCLVPVLEDITGSLTAWTHGVRDFLKESKPQIGDLVALLRSLRASPSEIGGVDALVSLNLLSQISIYWRDRVSNMLDTYWKLQSNEQGEFEEPIQHALQDSMRELEQSHLRQIAESGAARVLMIYDDLFMYYLRDRSDWQCEDALRVSADVALPGYVESAADSWFWHIAPQGIEQAEYGVIHRVRARAFRNNASERVRENNS
jgi:hypothetical protein